MLEKSQVDEYLNLKRQVLERMAALRLRSGSEKCQSFRILDTPGLAISLLSDGSWGGKELMMGWEISDSPLTGLLRWVAVAIDKANAPVMADFEKSGVFDAVGFAQAEENYFSREGNRLLGLLMQAMMSALDSHPL